MDSSGVVRWCCPRGLVMESSWVVLRLKQVLVMVHPGLLLCSPGNMGHVLGCSAPTESCCLWSILLCSDPLELVARLEADPA